MRPFVITVLLFISQIQMWSQTSIETNLFAVPYISSDRIHLTDPIKTRFNEVYNKRFFYSNSVGYKIIVNNELKNSVASEGMSTIYFNTHIFTVKFSNEIDPPLIELRFNIKGKGENEGIAKEVATAEFYNNPKYFEFAADSVYKVLFQKYHEGCDYLNLPEEMSIRELQYYKRLVDYTPEWASCYKNAKEKSNYLAREIELVICTDLINRLKLEIESRTYDPVKTVSNLLTIKSNSPCAKNALELAKKIGSHEREKLDKTSIQKLEAYIKNVGAYIK